MCVSWELNPSLGVNSEMFYKLSYRNKLYIRNEVYSRQNFLLRLCICIWLFYPMRLTVIHFYQYMCHLGIKLMAFVLVTQFSPN